MLAKGEDNSARKISTVFNRGRCVERLKKSPVSRGRVVRHRDESCTRERERERRAKPRNNDREIVMTNPSDWPSRHSPSQLYICNMVF